MYGSEGGDVSYLPCEAASGPEERPVQPAECVWLRGNSDSSEHASLTSCSLELHAARASGKGEKSFASADDWPTARAYFQVDAPATSQKCVCVCARTKVRTILKCLTELNDRKKKKY